MPSSRRNATAVASAALAATAVALPLTAVVLAAPAVAADLQPTAHGFRWQGGAPVSPAQPSPDAEGGGSPYSEQASSTDSLAGLDTSNATAAQDVGLVRISTVLDYGEGSAAGTGIVTSADGVIVTNHHVVAGSTSIKATVLSTGQTYTATLLGSSTRKDVAVLQLQGASGLATATTTTATSAAAAVTRGETVTAVGDAGGDSSHLTAAPGKVTSLKQKITVSDEQTGVRHRLRGLIQVSSDVIPGDSGGALRTSDGDVVGMTVAASSGHTSATVDGYVIPWGRVARVEQAVLAGQTTGDIELGYSAFLGVELSTQTSSTTIAGVVKDSPAAGAGLAAGDTVTSIGATPVSTAQGIRTALAAYAAGDSVSITWTGRGGAARSATLTLTTGPVA